MNKRQWRLHRIASVEQEFRAACTAANWLQAQVAANPDFGRLLGWQAKGASDFLEHLEATFLIRIYAEFEAGIRDYWRTHLNRDTRPGMQDLIRHAVPTQAFSQDCIDDADDVRIYRNFLVHDTEDQPPGTMITFTVATAKRILCTYFSRLNPRWK